MCTVTRVVWHYPTQSTNRLQVRTVNVRSQIKKLHQQITKLHFQRDFVVSQSLTSLLQILFTTRTHLQQVVFLFAASVDLMETGSELLEWKKTMFGKWRFEAANPIKGFKNLSSNFFAGSNELLPIRVSKSTLPFLAGLRRILPYLC